MLTDSASAAVMCRGVVRIYGSATGQVHALKGVDAIFPAGAFTAVRGPSGSGKSSLLRILAAQERPTAGVAVIAGASTSTMSARRLRALRRRHIGYVFQRPTDNLLPHLTVAEHLDLAARQRRLRGRGEADRLLERLGLGDRRHHRPGQLSGGEQQRVAFAQAVIGRPAVVIADEPTAELDSATSSALLHAVKELATEGVSVIMATHDAAAAAIADQVLYLQSGSIAAEQLGGRWVAVIDGDGRLQLPDDALRCFPSRRVVIDVNDGHVSLAQP